MKVIDMHCDTIAAIYSAYYNDTIASGTKISESSYLYENSFCIDLQKMKKGSYILQNFALYTNLAQEKDPFKTTLAMVDCFYQEMEKNSNLIRPVTTYQEIMDNHKKGLLSALLTIEEGEACQGNLTFLRNFYRLGVRMMTLTWNFENQLGFPNNFPKQSNPMSDSSYTYFRNGTPSNKGLKEKGLEFIAEMEQLGMIIDVSHLSDGGFYDVYNHTSRPFVASHSNARTLCPHCRNLTDDMIKKLGERGCVTGLNYFGNFLHHPSDDTHPKSDLAAMVRHAKYITNLGGISCLGLGSDFDGFSEDCELYDCSSMYLLADEMKKQGFSSGDIDKIFYQNVLNLYKELL